MLRFGGEDPEAKVRAKRQQEQLTEWADRDSRIKQERAKAEREANLYVYVLLCWLDAPHSAFVC
jgi:hypothetical protein